MNRLARIGGDLTVAAFVVLALPTIVAALAGTAYGQSVGPIQTVPGYPGCGGNTNPQTVTIEGIVCANRRTFTLNGQSRTVTAITKLNPDGTGSVSYMIEPAAVPFAVPLRIRSHVGLSSSGTPLTDDVSGELVAGNQGPMVLFFRYDCGQIDVKAVFTAPGDTRGRISGGYFCRTPDVTTTTAAPTTAPTTAPDTTAPPTVPVSTGVTVPTSGNPSTAGPTVTPGTIPATGSGSGSSALIVLACVFVVAGAVLEVSRRRRPTDG